MIERFRNLRISNKIVVGLSILVFLNLFVAARIYIVTRQATKSMELTQSVLLPSAITSAEAQANLLRMQSDVRGYLVLGELYSIDSYNQDRAAFESNLETLNDLSTHWTNQEDVKRLQTVQQKYTEWTPEIAKLFELHDDAVTNQPALLYEQENLVDLHAQLLQHIDMLLEDPQISNMSPSTLTNLIRFQSSTEAMATTIHAYAGSADFAFRVAYAVQLEQNTQTWQLIWASLEEFSLEQQTSLSAIVDLRRDYLTHAIEVFRLADQPDAYQDLHLFDTVTEPQTEEMLALLNGITANQRMLLNEELNGVSSTLTSALRQTIALGTLALNVGIFLTLVFQKLIAAPITRLIDTAEEISKGDLSARAKVESKDEVGQLGNTLNTMTTRLTATIEKLETMVNVSHDLIQARSMPGIIHGFFAKLDIDAISGAWLIIFGYGNNKCVTQLTVDTGWFAGNNLPAKHHNLEGEWGNIQVRELQIYTDLPAPLSELIGSLPDRNYVTIPLWAKSRQLGTLLIVSQPRQHLTKDNLTLISQNSGQLAIAVENRLLFRAVRQRAQDLALAIEQAQAANQAKNRFLATMSHELRTPLNAILGYTKILEEKTDDRNQLEKLQIIKDSGNHLLTLVEDVLDISKIEAGKLELVPKFFSLDAFLQRLINYCELRIQTRKGVCFRHETLSQLPPYVFADEKRLRQILLNLLSNAFKYTEKGTIQFLVSSSALPKKSELEYLPTEFQFVVSDEGIGISEDELPHIFEPFEQFGEEPLRIEGTGLGLAITHKLINAMGGNIEVESSLGEGSKFTVTVTLLAGWQRQSELTDDAIVEADPPSIDTVVSYNLDGVEVPNLSRNVTEDLLHLVELGEITELRSKVQKLASELAEFESFFHILQHHIDRFDEFGIVHTLNVIQNSQE